MRTVVINLPRHAERRALAASKLEAAGVPFEFVNGITYDEAIERNIFEGFDEHEFLLNTGRKMAPGEVGCFAAHRELWALSARLDEPLMIMEDDFELEDSFADAVAYADEVIDRVGFLRLQWSSRAKRRPISSRGDLTLSIYTKPPHCTMCYCISPTVARRFIEDTRIMDAPVDVYLKKYWEHKQPIFALVPYPVRQAPVAAQTTIGGRVKERKPPGVAIHRLLRKVSWLLQRTVFNLRARFTIPAD